MSDTNILYFSVDQQLASLRSKLLMSFGYQMHVCSSLADLEATLGRRRVQACIICQTVPDKLVHDAEHLLLNYKIPILVLTSGQEAGVAAGAKVESPMLRYCSSSAREFIPRLEALVPAR